MNKTFRTLLGLAICMIALIGCETPTSEGYFYGDGHICEYTDTSVSRSAKAIDEYTPLADTIECIKCGHKCEHTESLVNEKGEWYNTEHTLKIYHCETCGFTVLWTHAHDYGDNNETCSVCGYENPNYVAPSETPTECEHDWNDGEVTTTSTCTTNGVKTYTCSKCNETRTETVAMLEHSYGEWTTTKDATCVTDGTKTRTCSVCGKTETVTDSGSAKGHNYVAEVIPPTYDADGYTKHTCSKCGDTYNTDTVAKLVAVAPNVTNIEIRNNGIYISVDDEFYTKVDNASSYYDGSETYCVTIAYNNVNWLLAFLYDDSEYIIIKLSVSQ